MDRKKKQEQPDDFPSNHAFIKKTNTAPFFYLVYNQQSSMVIIFSCKEFKTP